MVKKTKMKDKIILVYYVGVKQLEGYESDIAENLKIDDDDSIFQYFIPVADSMESRVECINPVLVTEEKYAEAVQKLDEAKARMEKAIEEFSEKKNK